MYSSQAESSLYHMAAPLYMPARNLKFELAGLLGYYSCATCVCYIAETQLSPGTLLPQTMEYQKQSIGAGL